MMKKILTLTLFIVLARVSVARADEILLKEGKTLYGTITQETDTELTVRLANNMYLRVARSKVVSIAKDPKPVRTTYRMPLKQPQPGVKKSTATTTAPVSIVKSTQSAPTIAPTPGLRQARASVERKAVDKKPVRIVIDTVVSTYAVSGKTAGEAVKKSTLDKAGWRPNWFGTSAKDGTFYKWKEAVVVATVTVSYPFWKEGAAPSLNPAEADAWTAFLSGLVAEQEGRSTIYERALDSLAEELAQLNASSEAALKDESARRFDVMQKNAAKKLKGYDRHVAERKKVLTKN